MLPSMSPRRSRPSEIAIIGAGNLGSAIAVSLKNAGYRVAEIATRARLSSRRRAQKLAKRVGAKVVEIGPPLRADMIWLCVPDRAIRRCAESLAARGEWIGKTVFHSSGALGSRELRVLQKRGAVVASVHPLMTFVAGVVPDLAGVPFAVEGDLPAVREARGIVHAMGGDAFAIQEKHKAVYHAWGALASPLLLSLWVTAERVAELAGVQRADARKRMLPIIRQTLANYAERGPDHAFSGPIIRGDAATLQKHLRALGRLPDVRDVYLALARSAVRRLPAKNRGALRRNLNRGARIRER